MCNCIKETEDRFREQLSEKNSDFKDIEVTSAILDNKMIDFGTGGTTLGMAMTIEGIKLNKAGKKVNKKSTIHLTMPYCPMCGEKQE